MSKEYKTYIKRIKTKRIIILISQLALFISLLIFWEFSSKTNELSFITSSPSRILKTLIKEYNNNLIYHILITTKEVLISFILTSILSVIISIILYCNEFINKLLDPYLTMLNSLPKVALGPIIILLVGANTKGIILMAILISIIVSIESILNGFKNTDINKIKLLKTYNASKYQILYHVIIKGNIQTIINTLKVNISMCLIGTIMGEFLSSKAGVGYLILYGMQVFNLDLVISGIFILILLSLIFYSLLLILTKKRI